MYTDAYPSAIPSDRLDRLARATATCWTCDDVQRAWTCAIGAIGDSFCPCLAFAAGGFGGDREQAILEAVADEMKRHAERELGCAGEEPATERSAPVATRPTLELATES